MASLNSSYCFQLTCFTPALASSPPTFTLWAKYHGNRSLSVASSSPCLNISITDGTVRSLDRRLRGPPDKAVSARGKRSCTRQRTYGHPKVWFFFGKTISRKITLSELALVSLDSSNTSRSRCAIALNSPCEPTRKSKKDRMDLQFKRKDLLIPDTTQPLHQQRQQRPICLKRRERSL